MSKYKYECGGCGEKHNDEDHLCKLSISSDTDSVKDLYYELLYAVGKKYPGESRHETALRYILAAEAGSNIAGCEKSNEEG